MKGYRKTLFGLLRLAIGLAIIAFLVGRMDRQQMLAALREAVRHWPWLVLAHALMGLALLAVLIRWQRVLNALHLNLTWGRMTAIFWIGHFFNMFMPGGTGGDLLKAYYTARETAHQRTEGATSIFIDRTLGLLVLIAFIVILVLARIRFLWQHSGTRWISLILLGASLAMSVLLLALFRSNLSAKGQWAKRWAHRPRLATLIAIAEKAYNAFYACRREPALVWQTCLLSAASQIFAITAAYCVALSLGLRLQYVEFLTMAPMVAVFGAIPLAPGGRGTSELGATILYGALGVGPEKAPLLTFIPYLSLLVWALAGGVIYILYSSSAGTLQEAEREGTHE